MIDRCRAGQTRTARIPSTTGEALLGRTEMDITINMTPTAVGYLVTFACFVVAGVVVTFFNAKL